MDGELESHEAKHIIAALEEDSELRKDWETYHLIGDTIRYEAEFFSQHNQTADDQLSTKPALASNPTKLNNRKTYTFAIAASVVAAVVTTWFSLQNIDQIDDHNTLIANQKSDSEQPSLGVTPITASSMNTGSSLLAHPLAPAEIDDYLFVHKEFLPGAVTHSQSMYVRPVINSPERYGR